MSVISAFGDAIFVSTARGRITKLAAGGHATDGAGYARAFLLECPQQKQTLDPLERWSLHELRG